MWNILRIRYQIHLEFSLQCDFVLVCSATLNLVCSATLNLVRSATLRWLEIVYWHARPVPLNTATESRPMHATFKLNMLRARAHQARACANNDLVPSKSLENLDFDQKCL